MNSKFSKSLLLVIILFSMVVTASGQGVVFFETFPNEADPWNGSNQRSQDEGTWFVTQGDGDNDDIRVENEEGRMALRFRDCDEGFASPSSPYDFVYINIDLSPYQDCELSYDWFADDTDAGEGMKVEYSINSTNGINGTWTTLGSHINETHDVWFTEGPIVLPANAHDANFKLRISSRSSATKENMYIDDIKIETKSAPLPVELLDFSLQKEEGGVTVLWSTATETNNDYFTLERAFEANTEWEQVAMISGVGTSNEKIEYTFYDEIFDREKVYYRLKQTDFDGSFTYSNVQVISFQLRQEAKSISVYPNPTSDYVSVTGDAEMLQHLRVFSQSGNDLTPRIFIEPNNDESLRLDLSELEPGIYFIRLGEQVSKVVRN